VTTFEPRQTRDWSTRELAALIGKQVRIVVGGWSALSGVVADASVGRFGQAFVDFTHGGSVSWDRHTDQATITVEPTGGQP
jgi:hypothetical protein